MNIRISSFVLAGVFALGSLGFSVSAQADHRRGDRYDDRYDQQVEVCNYCGTVRAISRINRSSRRNTNATVLGALIGGAVGNQIGKGDGRRAATVAGAVAGGVIANNNSRDRHGRTIYRIVVRMDRGRTFTFDQDSAYGLRPGARVEVRDGWVVPLR